MAVSHKKINISKHINRKKNQQLSVHLNYQNPPFQMSLGPGLSGVQNLWAPLFLHPSSCWPHLFLCRGHCHSDERKKTNDFIYKAQLLKYLYNRLTSST